MNLVNDNANSSVAVAQNSSSVVDQVQVTRALTGLKELSIGFYRGIVKPPYRHVPAPVIKLISEAQNIESLDLYSEESYLNGYMVPYACEVEDTFSQLSLHHFRKPPRSNF
ncbi:hypothetical protein OPQ81_008372 [Rhizoctonia solani]|nr:hypothetical protein OPQ81_008372 [Rhizoctonia solani]